MKCSFHRWHFLHSFARSFTATKTKLMVKTGVLVKHKYHVLILPDGIIIPVVEHCIKSRDSAGKGKRGHVWRNTVVWTGEGSRARTDV